MEPLPAFFGQAVVLRPAILLRRLPFRDDPPFQLQPLQRRIEGTELDVEGFSGRRPDRLGDAVAMERAEDEGPQDEHVEEAVQRLHGQTAYIKTVCISRLSL